jgi:mannose PTS system EIID component
VKGSTRALARLLAVQGVWSYERMLGIGMGYAAEPLLRDLQAIDPARHAEATIRSAEFFNSHPYLAGLAVGAATRAEYDSVPGEQIRRFRTALCGPLGALGDQVFWAGLVPGIMAFALVSIALGVGGSGLLVAVLGYNAIRLAVTVWGLRTGLATGLQVGSAISASWLPRAASRIGAPSGFLIGAALSLIAAWFLVPLGRQGYAVAAVTASVGLALAKWGGTRFTSLRFGLMTVGLTLLWMRFAPWP